MSGDRLIRFLLRLYPADFRGRYGQQMLAFHRERIGNASPLTWSSIVADHVTSALRERMSCVTQDVRYALRGMARRPTFTAIILGTIALGVGANSAIFSVVYGVMIQPLPYPNAERVVSFGHKPTEWLTSQPEFLDYKRGLTTFEGLSAYTTGEGNLSTETDPERIALASVSPEFFSVLGVNPALGRRFAVDEDIPRPATVAILSHALWQRRFSGDSGIIGKTVMMNGVPRVVIGVMPKYFDYPTAQTDMWLPMQRINTDSLGDRANHYLFMVGRVKPGVRLERAVGEANTLAKRQMQDNPGKYDPNMPLVPVIERVSDHLLGKIAPYLWALLGAVGFVLLIVCVNVANLLLARGEGRRKEMALRTALGATRARLASQLFTECVVLALCGGMIGLLIAWGGQRGLIALAPDSIPRLDHIALNWMVVTYTFAISVVVGLIFALAPAVRASREAPGDTLKEGGKASHGGSHRVRRVLVIAEVALAVTMLTGAGMLLKSLEHLRSNDIGFDTHSVLTAKVSPVGTAWSEARLRVFYAQLLERVRAIPGVRSAGASGWLPVVEAGGLWSVLAEGQSYDNVPEQPSAVPQQATTGYFASMGMPIVKGRDFTEADREGGPYSVVISKSLAAQLWPAAEPIGRRVRLGGTQTFMTVVGVVPDILARGFNDSPEPTMYFPYRQTNESAYFMPRPMSLVIRTTVEPMVIAKQVRAIIRSLDPSIPVSNVRTLDQVVGVSVANRQFSTALITAFAALALVLAGIGIFGVISYAVSERTFEIGVRVALGAEKRSVLALVVGDGVLMAGIGLLLGSAGTVVVARAIRSMLVGVPAFDVSTVLVVGVLLASVVVAASILPARRALKISAIDALRGG
jgi:putative ABC transport system permease protein